MSDTLAETLLVTTCTFVLNLLGTLINYTLKSTRTITPQDVILSHKRLPFRHKGFSVIHLMYLQLIKRVTGLSPILFNFPDNYRQIVLLEQFDHLY